jgi:hypothetical protein
MLLKNMNKAQGLVGLMPRLNFDMFDIPNNPQQLN